MRAILIAVVALIIAVSGGSLVAASVHTVQGPFATHFMQIDEAMAAK